MNDTQRYAVYHANDVLETNLPPAMRWYADKSMYYTHVADVVAPLEQIFTLTKHIDHPGRTIRRWSGSPRPGYDPPRSVTSLSPLRADRPGWSCPLACRNSLHFKACIQAMRTPQARLR